MARRQVRGRVGREVGPSQPAALWRRADGGSSSQAPLAWLVIVGAPIYYTVIVGLEPESSFLVTNPWYPSKGVTLQNYLAVFNSGFWTYLRNSVVVAGGATLISISISLLAAFAVVYRVSRPTGLIFSMFLIGFAVPIQALIIPLYVEILRTHLYNTLIGLILPLAAFSLPITVLILVNFLRDVPRELMNAMQIDGATPLQVLRLLVLPVTLPAVMTVAIFDFVTAWNNFLFPLILTQSSSNATLPLAVFNFEGTHFSNVPNIMACVAISAAPLLLLYLVGRKRMLVGLTAGLGV